MAGYKDLFQFGHLSKKKKKKKKQKKKKKKKKAKKKKKLVRTKKITDFFDHLVVEYIVG